MAAPRLPLRIAVVQFSPKIGQVHANIARAREFCAKLKPQSVDLVCLPEMIFTGYVFPNAAAISPHLEQPRIGPTSVFCAELAERLRCHVVAGYPERLEEDEVEIEEGIDKDGIEFQHSKIGANSAVLFGPTGEWVGGYRKTNLFETDTTWAKPGSGFATFSLPSPLRTMCLGICMDLNAQPPAPWLIKTGPYELADHCLSKRANLLILLNAWLDSNNEVEEEQDWSTLNFGAARLRPLWVKPEMDADSTSGSSSGNESESDYEEGGSETIVVVCNRSGEDNGTKFAGSSAIFSLRQGLGRPKLLDMMDRHEEGVRVWDVLV